MVGIKVITGLKLCVLSPCCFNKDIPIPFLIQLYIFRQDKSFSLAHWKHVHIYLLFDLFKF